MNTIFKVFDMTQQKNKPKSIDYKVNALTTNTISDIKMSIVTFVEALLSK